MQCSKKRLFNDLIRRVSGRPLPKTADTYGDGLPDGRPGRGGVSPVGHLWRARDRPAVAGEVARDGWSFERTADHPPSTAVQLRCPGATDIELCLLQGPPRASSTGAASALGERRMAGRPGCHSANPRHFSIGFAQNARFVAFRPCGCTVASKTHRVVSHAMPISTGATGHPMPIPVTDG